MECVAHNIHRANGFICRSSSRRRVWSLGPISHPSAMWLLAVIWRLHNQREHAHRCVVLNNLQSVSWQKSSRRIRSCIEDTCYRGCSRLSRPESPFYPPNSGQEFSLLRHKNHPSEAASSIQRRCGSCCSRYCVTHRFLYDKRLPCSLNALP